jgi:fused signal recognition particle receptor
MFNLIYTIAGIVLAVIIIALIIIIKNLNKNKGTKDYYTISRESQENLGQRLRNLFKGKTLDTAAINQLEETLLKADIGPRITADLITLIKEKAVKSIDEAIPIIKEEIKKGLIDKELKLKKNELNILMVLGVNGVGKTTSIAKMANYFLNQGFKVLLAAGDTFRAAAIEQLTKWANKLDIPVIKQQQHSDPAGVIFDAIDAAKAKGVDLLIIDTAGRLHTKVNLMDELKKIDRVIQKKEIKLKQNILVIDATTGQNAYHQADSFNQAVKVDGIMLTKYDSLSKGGILINIQKNLGLPFYFIGTGEKLENIKVFNKEEFVENIFN